MNLENIFLKIINETIADNSYIGDDCAYLEEYGLVISQDTLIEGVHFQTTYFSACDIGKKALLVNISDILASGGIPKYLTISLSGFLNEDFIKNFYTGANEIAQKYGVKIIGGDLTGGEKITVSICILGDTKGRKISSRKNAKTGYEVYLKGFHGSSAKGLWQLLSGDFTKNEFTDAHIEPKIYPEISNLIATGAKFPYAMTDTSDGLYDALLKIGAASNVGFEIEYDKIPKRLNDKDMVLFGGEDFGLLICAENSDCKGFIETEDFRKIGMVTGSKNILLDGEIITKDKTFSHFNPS